MQIVFKTDLFFRQFAVSERVRTSQLSTGCFKNLSESDFKKAPLFIENVRYNQDQKLVVVEFAFPFAAAEKAVLTCSANCPENYKISSTSPVISWPVVDEKSLDQKFTITAQLGSLSSTKDFVLKLPNFRAKEAAVVSPTAPTVGVDLSQLKAENLRAGVIIAGVTGKLFEKPNDCNDNSQIGCVTTSSFKSADLTNLYSDKIISGSMIAGVSGTVLPRPLDCSANAEIGCVTSSIFKAANLENLTPINIKSNVTVAGVTGILAVKPADCLDNGDVGCVTTNSFKSADLTNLRI